MKGFPDKRIVDAGGTRLAVYEAGEGPPVLLVHGWPEIAYSWKNQIPALAAAGYRAVAFDVKGFGASDAPRDPALYSSRQLTDDFAALLDALKIEKAVFCGHDWGGALVWAMAQLHPERVAGVIGVCTPLKARPPVPPLGIVRKRLGENHYFIYFQTPDEPEKLFETDPALFFRIMFRKPAAREDWPGLIPRVFDIRGRFKHGGAPDDSQLVLGREDIEVYIDAYRRSGFHGGINLYRNIDRNWEMMAGRDEIVRAPSLWVGAELDLFLPVEAADDLDKLVPDVEKHILSGCGHWAMWEKPVELNAIIVDWLNRRIR
ncbi:MAG: alpha/beta hydrolase [Pseudomonadota bacterium]|nr:alpha/beta hydrolase [Pseudomonadota bacterium]